MKRYIAFFLILCFAVSLPFAGNAETEIVNSYDFVLQFKLEPNDYPYRMRKYMEGYEQLLDMLEVKGNLSWCDATQSFDLRVELVPVTNPSAAISFRIYGLQDYMNVSSPLLGSQAYYVEVYDIIKLTSYARQVASIPLCSYVIYNPYATKFFLKSEVDTWNSIIPDIHEKKKITGKQLKEVSDAWKEQLIHDYWLRDWLKCISAMMPDNTPVTDTFYAIPDQLLNVTYGKDLTIQKQNEYLRIQNSKKDVLFEEKNTEQDYTCELQLPDTGAAYKPYFFYHQNTESEAGKNIEMKILWEKETTEIEQDDGNPASLLRYEMDLNGIPDHYPAKVEITANVSMGGSLLHEAVLGFLLKTEADGNIRLTVSSANEDKIMKPVVSCSGTVKPAKYGGELRYEYDELHAQPLLLDLSYNMISDLVKKIAPNIMNCAIDFLYEIPIQAYQSIMDDMEAYGLITLLTTNIK